MSDYSSNPRTKREPPKKQPKKSRKDKSNMGDKDDKEQAPVQEAADKPKDPGYMKADNRPQTER